MPGELLQHVIEKADPGRNVEHAGAIEIDRGGDLGLLGLAGNCRLPLHFSPLRLSLPHLDRAFISLGRSIKGSRPRLAGPAPRVPLQCIRPAQPTKRRSPGTRPPYSPFVKM